VVDATILVRGVAGEARTDVRGRFTIRVPAGELAVSVIHPEYATQTRSDLAALPGAEVESQWVLTPSAYQMEAIQVVSNDEIQVQGGVAALADETRNSGVVLNLMGSEQISRSGDSDAAGALGRVTGLTVVGGKYVYVRGMGDRYSATSMNGFRLPSPELDRRVVPLDLFPSSVIESLSIQKTFSPDLYGDFSGGVVSVRTLGIPQDRFQRRLRGSVGLSLTFDPETTFQTADFQQTGPGDWLGWAGASRALPAKIDPNRPVTESSFAGDGGYTAAEMTALGRSFSNAWAPVRKLILPDLSLQFSLRDKIDLDRLQQFGWSLAVQYKHQMANSTEVTKEYADNGGGNVSLDTVTTTDSQEVDLSGLLNLEYQWNQLFQLRSTTLLTRITTDEWALTTGFQKDIDEERVYEASWVEQTLLNQGWAATGKVTLGLPMDYSAHYSFSLANRSEPDHRQIGYGRDGTDPFQAANQVGKTYRLFLNADDQIHDVSGSILVPVPWLGDASDRLQLGGQGIWQSRKVTNNRYTFDFRGAADTTLGLDDILDPARIDNSDLNAVRFYENTKPSDNYVGSHTVTAGWVNFDLQLFDSWRLAAGVRAEDSLQVIDTFELGRTDKVPTQVLLHNLDLLPAVNLTWSWSASRQLRLAASRTVNRPDFLEISNTVKEGLPGTGLYRGNPGLRRASILNADLRYEEYLTAAETWSLGFFYKDFTDPIEVTESSGSSGEKYPVNIPKATSVGAELEASLSFAWLAEVLGPGLSSGEPATTQEFFDRRRWAGTLGNALRDLTLAGNASLVWSQIDYAGQDPGNNTSTQRPLQGQSPWILNLSLNYRNSQSWSPVVRSDTTVNVSYNVFGPRLRTIGTGSLHDTYEQPFHQVDLTVRHRLDEFWSLDLKVRNVLDLPAVETLDGLVLSQERKGRTLTIGVRYDF